MPYREPDHLAACSIMELVLGGDWACSENQTLTLAEVARHIAAHLESDERGDLLQVARLCDCDMTAATELWNVATAPMRGRSHRPLQSEAP